MATFIDVLCAAAGGAFVWFAKDTIVKVVSGTDNFIKTLEAKIAAAKAAKATTTPPPATK